MSIRSDFTINWEASPRVIIVDSPSVNCTMQDLLDTLRFEESKMSNMDNPAIVSASGKEPLDVTTKVGLTVSLQNAQIGFEARSGPDWTICSLDGGNLVSFGTDGETTIESLYATAFVSISKTSSSSATQTEQLDIQYTTYQNSVWVDIDSLQTGIEYPSGNREHPVNNIEDAVTIAHNKGFSTLQLLSDTTLDTGDNVEDFELTGRNPTQTAVTILDPADTLNCEITQCTLNGILDGGTTLTDCAVGILNYVNGSLHHCMLNNKITLGGSSVAHMHGCYSGVPGIGTPELDCGGAGQSFALRAYDGGIKITNKTGPEAGSIDLNSGQIRLTSTITNGSIICRGTGKVIDDVTGELLPAGTMDWNGCTVIIETSLNVSETILHSTDFIDKAIYVDTEATTNGDGTLGNPFDNIGDTIDAAEEHGFKSIMVYSEIELDRNLKNFNIIGVGNPVIKCNGNDLSKSEFSHCTLRGSYTGSINVEDSILDNGLELNGYFKNCGISGNLTSQVGSNALLKDCVSLVQNVTIDQNSGGASVVNLTDFAGNITITNCNTVGDVAFIGIREGTVTIDSSCTAGFIAVGGKATPTDNSAGTIVDLSGLLQNVIAETVLDAEA